MSVRVLTLSCPSLIDHSSEAPGPASDTANILVTGADINHNKHSLSIPWSSLPGIGVGISARSDVIKIGKVSDLGNIQGEVQRRCRRAHCIMADRGHLTMSTERVNKLDGIIQQFLLVHTPNVWEDMVLRSPGCQSQLIQSPFQAWRTHQSTSHVQTGAEQAVARTTTDRKSECFTGYLLRQSHVRG